MAAPAARRKDASIARARLTDRPRRDRRQLARARRPLRRPSVETAAVVKADAYGLGAAAVGPGARRAPAPAASSSPSPRRARALRDALGPGPAIHVFAGLMPGDAALCPRPRPRPLPQQRRADARTSPATLPGRPCALQLDSGMNRLGLEPAELAAAADLLPRLAPVLAISHLACADEPGAPDERRAGRAPSPPLAARLPGVRLSLAATGGILLGPDFHLGLTRPGIGLYGGLPFADARPVVTPRRCRSSRSATSPPARRSATAPPGPPPAPVAHRHRRRRLRRRPAARPRRRRGLALFAGDDRLPDRRPGLDGPDHRRRHRPRARSPTPSRSSTTARPSTTSPPPPAPSATRSSPALAPATIASTRGRARARTPHDPPPPRPRLPRLDRPLDARASSAPPAG